MKNTKASKQKLTATRVVKTSETVSLRSGTLPVYRASAKSLIDPSEFIPIADGKKAAGGGVKLLRRTDLFPQEAVQLGASPKFSSWQMQLDEFSPIYGTFHYLRPSYFEFGFSKLVQTTGDFWQMDRGHVLGVNIFTRSLLNTGVTGNYVSVLLGETNCNTLTVEITNPQYPQYNLQFNLDLCNRSNQFFDLWLSENISYYQLRLSSSLEGGLCKIEKIRLYSTMHILPPVVEP
jgi:hypothetical protein